MPPIKPSEVSKQKANSIPDEVYDVFNKLIVKHWDGHSAHVTKEEAIDGISDAMGVTRRHIFDEGWLDVEAGFEEAGWNVKYESPGWDESWGSFFIFKKGKS